MSSKKMFGDLVRQAQAFQEKLAKLQEEAGQKVVEASAGGGMVIARANGRGELLSVKIDPEIVKSGDVEMLGDLVVAAVNEAVRKGKAEVEGAIKGLTGGLGFNIPGLF
jgi:DNA-binding YbaB/EbfC family protein